MSSTKVERWLQDARRIKETAEALELRLQQTVKLTLNEYYVLYFLSQSEQKKMRLNVLQESVGLSQSAMSRMIVRMEDKTVGVIERRHCPLDKRGIYIGLTVQGETILAEAQRVVEAVLVNY